MNFLPDLEGAQEWVSRSLETFIDISRVILDEATARGIVRLSHKKEGATKSVAPPYGTIMPSAIRESSSSSRESCQWRGTV